MNDEDSVRFGESRGSREAVLAETIGAVTESLLDDDLDLVDVLDQLMTATVEVLAVSAAAVLLDDQKGNLAVAASSTEETLLLEMFQLHMGQGPCLDCIRSGALVASDNLAADRSRWPAFVDAALLVGYRTVVAVPLRIRNYTIGGLNLFGAAAEPMTPEHRHLAQALADLTTIAILQQREVRRSSVLAGQLQHALDSRVIIEQAKGALAERYRIDTGRAFDGMRRYSRQNNLKIGDIAAAVIRGEVDPLAPGAAGS